MSTLQHETFASRVRPQFPALTRMIAGQPVAYFDGPGGTQVPRRVVDAMSNYLFNHNANDGWAFRTSVETERALHEARIAAAAFVNAASPDEMVFGNNMTTLTFVLAAAIGRTLQPGDEIVVTDLDHHADVDPWVALERDYGAQIKRVPLRANRAELDLEAYEQLLGPRTRLVAIGASSNAFGTINPVAQISAAAHRAGALVFVDAVHAAAHAPVDAQALGADMLAYSAYKVYGPHVGIAYCRDELLERLDFPRIAPQVRKGSKRVESGTLNHEGIVGTGAAIAFLADLADVPDATLRERVVTTMNRLVAEEGDVFATLVDGLRHLPNVTLYEPPPGIARHPTIAFSVDRYAAADVAARLSEDRAIFVSHGNFYAARAVAQIAPDANAGGGIVRAGLSIYSTHAEAQRLVSAIAALE